MNYDGMDVINGYLSKIKETVVSSGLDLDKYEVFYRGENKYFETTISSIFRKGLENEHKIFRELELRYPNIFDNAKSTIDKLAIMQHYGLPTRLLDFTTNPLLALYMAIDNDTITDFSPTVKVVFVNKEKIKYYDSDTVSVLANFTKVEPNFSVEIYGLANNRGKIEKAKRSMAMADYTCLDNHEKLKDLDKSLKYDAGKMICDDSASVHYLLHQIKGEKPYFKEMIWAEHFDKTVIFVKPKYNTQRVINQAGLFALFGISDGKKEDFSLEDCQENEHFTMNVLPLTDGDTPCTNECVQDVKKALGILGITYDKVYPEIEYSTKYIKEYFLN